MLDIYKMSDKEINDGNPNETDYIESFSLEEFKELAELLQFAKSNSIEFSFFNDFKLSNLQAEQLLQFTNKTIEALPISFNFKKETYIKMHSIFQIVVDSGVGIKAFCD